MTFPDVPEAHTAAADRDAALAQAADCLAAALGAYVHLRRPIPVPSAITGLAPVTLAPLLTAKLALYTAMQDARVSNVELARRMGLTEGAIRKLLDLDRASHIDQVAAALAALGKRLSISVLDAT